MTESVAERRIDILDVEFDAIDAESVVADVMASIREGTGGWIVTPNVDILRQIRRNPEYWAMVERASLVVVDGAPVQWAGRIAGHGAVPRVPGANLVGPLIRAAAELGRPVLLLGGRPGASERAAATLQQEFPHLTVLENCPPFGFEADTEAWAEVVAAVEAADGGIVLCGFGFPKQERLMAAMSVLYPRTWFVGVGGTIDFLAGAVRRAPDWVQRIGFEWAFRLLMEPRRLARRYLIDGPPFAVRMLGWAAARRLRRDAPAGARPVRPVDLPRTVAVDSARAVGHEVPGGVAPEQGRTGSSPSPGESWVVEALRQLCEPGTPPAVRSGMLERLVERLRMQGRYADCVGLLRERLTLPFDDPRHELVAQMQLARFLMESGALRDAVRSATDAVAGAERSGLARTVEGVKLRVTLADMLRMTGDMITADLQIGLALRAAHRNGDPISLGSALWNAALVSAGQGRYVESLGLARAARETFAGLGNDLAVALVSLVEASATLDSGAVDVGWLEEPLAHGVDVVRARGTIAQQGVALTQVARVELRLGRTERAHSRVGEALALLNESNAVDHPAARSVEAQVLAALGEHEEALRVADAAAADLRRIGAAHLADRVWIDLAHVAPATAEAGARGAPRAVVPAPGHKPRPSSRVPAPRPAGADRPSADRGFGPRAVGGVEAIARSAQPRPRQGL